MSDQEMHPVIANDEGVDTEDADPGNVALRAGYLGGLAERYAEGSDERNMLKRAGRSLFHFQRSLDAKGAQASFEGKLKIEVPNLVMKDFERLREQERNITQVMKGRNLLTELDEAKAEIERLKNAWYVRNETITELGEKLNFEMDDVWQAIKVREKERAAEVAKMKEEQSRF